MAKSASINLLKRSDKNFTDRVIYWALTAGRVVIYITFTVAIVCLIYRGFLDRQIVDLHDSIKQKQALLTYSKPSEEKFRNIQDRLSAANVGDKAKDKVTLLTDIIDFAPVDASFNTLTESNDTISFDITLKSVPSLTAFINKLKDDPRISSITLSKIDDKLSSTTITASISLKLE